MTRVPTDSHEPWPPALGWPLVIRHVLGRWRLISACTLAAGALAAVVAMLLTPIYTARTSILPPQGPQSLSAAALTALGPLAPLAGLGGRSNSTEQYVALLRSETISNRIIEAFDLKTVYDTPLVVDARRLLNDRVNVTVGRKDGLIALEVDDESPVRAADMANRYIQELRRLGNELALTEAQQRRKFFESQLESARRKLAAAQGTLQASGYTARALRAEPRATAESYARLKAEADAAEVKLRLLLTTLAEGSHEVQQQRQVLTALRARLAALEAEATTRPGDSEYLASYREFKYQESLFELFARQFEVARLDEAREGAVIQVLDSAAVPERRARPRRTQIVAGAMLASLLLAVGAVAATFISRHPRAPQRA